MAAAGAHMCVRVCMHTKMGLSLWGAVPQRHCMCHDTACATVVCLLGEPQSHFMVAPHSQEALQQQGAALQQELASEAGEKLRVAHTEANAARRREAQLQAEVGALKVALAAQKCV